VNGETLLGLARVRDSQRLAEMSRDLIEHDLGWSWSPARIRRKILCPENIVLVARAGNELAGFAIMYIGTEEARLNLLAVTPGHRRKGIGRRLVQWLEESALVAGVSVVYLEVRASAHGAQQFYRKLGYRQVQSVRGYYGGHEAALRMARDLWCGTPNKV
jgi:ribosomal-protein-alanine N-acetyltransferase